MAQFQYQQLEPQEHEFVAAQHKELAAITDEPAPVRLCEYAEHGRKRCHPQRLSRECHQLGAQLT